MASCNSPGHPETSTWLHAAAQTMDICMGFDGNIHGLQTSTHPLALSGPPTYSWPTVAAQIPTWPQLTSANSPALLGSKAPGCQRGESVSSTDCIHPHESQALSKPGAVAWMTDTSMPSGGATNHVAFKEVQSPACHSLFRAGAIHPLLGSMFRRLSLHKLQALHRPSH